VHTAGKAKLIVGRSKVTFDITRAWDVLTYAALHLGDHNVNGGVREFRGDEAFQQLAPSLRRCSTAPIFRRSSGSWTNISASPITH
jgi:hypothetical protein